MKAAAEQPNITGETRQLLATLARRVNDGDCVLVLGPGAVMAMDENGQFSPLTTLCARFLAEKYKLDLEAAESYDLSYVTSLLRVQNRSTDNVLQEEMAAFYANMGGKGEMHPMLEQLADLNFRIVLHSTPDNFITEYYDQLLKPYYTDFYNWYKPNTRFDIDFDKDQRTVVYNLLGHFSRPESLVVTYKQQLGYVKRVSGEQQNERLPDALRNAFKDFRHHIFLGFDFEDWTLRIILDTLYKNVRENVQTYAFTSRDRPQTESRNKLFFQGEFGMQFPALDMETFVVELSNACKELANRVTAPEQKPKAKVLVLYNEAADREGYQLLMKHLSTLPADFITLDNAIGQGDLQSWLRKTLDECQIVLLLLSAGFYDDAYNPALPMLDEIAQRNNPRAGYLVMPILLKPVALDGPLAQLATRRPSDRQAIMGSGKEDQYFKEIEKSLDIYIANLTERGQIIRESEPNIVEQPLSEQPDGQEVEQAEEVAAVAEEENVPAEEIAVVEEAVEDDGLESLSVHQVPNVGETKVPRSKPLSEPERRYPGLRPFSTDEQHIFFGRSGDAQRLVELTSLERVTTLFGKSGVGKSSLIQAGCFGLWNAQNIVPVYIRLDRPDALSVEWLNRILQPNTGELNPNESPLTRQPYLWAKFKSDYFRKTHKSEKILFVFDQFEEAFTLHQNAERQPFLEELASIANSTIPASLGALINEAYETGQLSVEDRIWWETPPEVHMLFVLRSDFLDRLEEISRIIPTIWRNRYQLHSLTREQAQQAMVAPGMLEGNFVSPPFEYEQVAIAQIMDFLTGGSKDEVESFNLQIVCQQLEEIIMERNGQTRIVDPNLYGGKEGLYELLRYTYEHKLRSITDLNQQNIARKIIEEDLISPGNRRLSLVGDAIKSNHNVDDAFLGALVQTSLVRKEARLDDFYYEISHDVLLPAILASRDTRRKAEEEAEAVARLKWEQEIRQTEDLKKGGASSKTEKEEKAAKLNEAKLVFIGEPGTGKSTLVNKLFEQNTSKTSFIDRIFGASPELPKLDTKSRSLKTIRYTFQSKQSEELTANIWDFGGQEFYHALPQLFFSKQALYVLTVDKKNDNANLINWLQTIESRGQGSPVMVVVTMTDINPSFSLDSSKLRSDFPFVKDVYYVSSLNNKEVDKLREAIHAQFEQLPQIGQVLPKNWLNIRSLLNNLSAIQQVGQFSGFIKLCHEQGETDTDAVRELASKLHELGDLCYFPDDPVLSNVLFLQPQWLSSALGRLFDDPAVIERRGKIELADIDWIWAAPDFSDYKQELLALALKFELIYRLPDNSDAYIAPQLLPINAPQNYQLPQGNELSMKLNYGFMPRELLSRFIAINYQWIVGDPALVWRYGVVLKIAENLVEIWVEFDPRRVHILAIGPNPREALTIVLHAFDRIHESYGDKLQVEKLVPCICSFCQENKDKRHYYKQETLLRYSEKNKYAVQCEQSFEDVDVKALLNYSPITPPGVIQEFLIQWGKPSEWNKVPAVDLLSRFSAPGRKAILAIESAGMHFVAQAAVLEALESKLSQMSGNPDYRLSDTFDLIGGAGLGAISAMRLARGWPVKDVRDCFLTEFREYTQTAEPSSIHHDAIRLADDNPWQTGVLYFQREPATGGLKFWSNHPEATQAPFDPTINPKAIDVNTLGVPQGANIPLLLSVDPGLFQNPELLLFHIATHPDYPFKWQKGEDNLLVVSIAAPNTLPANSEDGVVRALAQAQEKHNRLAEWFFAGYAPSGPRNQVGVPLGKSAAHWLRIDQLALPTGELPSEEFLKEQANKALDNVELTVIMPPVTA